MQIDAFTFLAQIINFLILLWLLKKFLYGPVLKVMKKREDEVSARLEEARIKLKKAEDLGIEYQDKMEQLEERKENWLEEAKQDAESYKKELMHTARSAIEKIESKWQESIKLDRISFLESLERRSFLKIVETVERIITDLADGNLEEQALKIFLGKLKQMDSKEKERITKMAVGGNIEIMTSFEMNETYKIIFINTIHELFSREIGCLFKTDLDLGFGVEIRTNGWKSGWNLKSYLDDLRSDLENFIDAEYGSKRESKPVEHTNI